jgi:multicomponent Na+:H+ antiporter subunit E
MVPIQVLLNIFIGFLWMLLQDKWSFPSFVAGYLVGMVILFFMRRFFSKSFYLGTFLSLLKLLLVFMKELVSSTILVLKQVTRRKIDVQPGVFALKTELNADIGLVIITDSRLCRVGDFTRQQNILYSCHGHEGIQTIHH